ncbi:MAG: hypothetical protein SFV81_23370 [Pirellulaceae bacterium]|nr:hypothetical protein [Pirellulaceae bacterium]
MNSGSSRYRSALIREDAYFSEVDQILLANLRETLELQAEAQECAAGNRCGCGLTGNHECSESNFVESDRFAAAR